MVDSREVEGEADAEMVYSLNLDVVTVKTNKPFVLKLKKYFLNKRYLQRKLFKDREVHIFWFHAYILLYGLFICCLPLAILLKLKNLK